MPVRVRRLTVGLSLGRWRWWWAIPNEYWHTYHIGPVWALWYRSKEELDARDEEIREITRDWGA